MCMVVMVQPRAEREINGATVPRGCATPSHGRAGPETRGHLQQAPLLLLIHRDLTKTIAFGAEITTQGIFNVGPQGRSKYPFFRKSEANRGRGALRASESLPCTPPITLAHPKKPPASPAFSI